MSNPTLREQCLAVAQRFSAYLPEPLEQEDRDELMHYIEDLVRHQLAKSDQEKKDLASKLDEHNISDVSMGWEG